VPALEDLEARVAANQREMAETLRDHTRRLSGVEVRLTSVETKVDDTNSRVRSLEDTTSEIRELLIRALDR
jgi:chromosome condensin MukBEF ATPase and DNA-binding subunit MukB